MAETLASHGYIVITIDTPVQADIIEYPDGSYLISPEIGTDAQLEAALPDRVQDILFVKNKPFSGQGLPAHYSIDATRSPSGAIPSAARQQHKLVSKTLR